MKRAVMAVRNPGGCSRCGRVKGTRRAAMAVRNPGGMHEKGIKWAILYLSGKISCDMMTGGHFCAEWQGCTIKSISREDEGKGILC